MNDEIQDLALEMSGLDLSEFDLDDWVYNKYEVNSERFCKIVEDLLDYTPVLKSPLTGVLSHCFGITLNPKTGLFQAIVKKDIKND